MYLLLTMMFTNSFSETVNNQEPVSILPTQLQDFSQNPQNAKLIHLALDLTTKKLTYRYGSADPKNGGMDCSGTIYYLLTTMGLKDIPRSSDEMYKWVWQKGHFYAVNSSSFSSFEFSHLKAGDLLFWSGTYETNRELNVTHVMLYLGKDKHGNPLMVGSSNGRTYQGKKIYGVSIFDFRLPEANSKSQFLGYSCIPEINC